MKKEKHISLSITESCNLNCVYCFEKSKSSKKMDFDTAIRVIDEELNHSEDYDAVAVDFMGGEPFLEFELIKSVCEHYWGQENKKRIVFFTTTNGTLVKEHIKEWLRTNKERFSCMLSLDGIPEAHNVNRSNSFARIDIDFFREMWPEQKVKGIVSQETLCYLSDSVIYLHKLGFSKIEMKLAYGFDWSNVKQSVLLQKELSKLVDFYVKYPHLTPCTLINLKVQDVLLSKDVIKKWCNAGERTISYDMDGNPYPCRYFQDLRKNQILSLDEMWKVDYQQIQNLLEEPCRSCILRNLCRTCYAFNYEQNGSYGQKNFSSCKITREMAYMSAVLKRKRMEMSEEEKQSAVMEACIMVEKAYKENQWFLGV